MRLEFYPPCAAWSVNQKRHWAADRRDRELWFYSASIYARQANFRGQPFPLSPSTVAVTIPFDSNRRRDPHNYTGTVVKAIIDGLVRAGCWPDDTAEFVTVIDPKLVVGGPVVVEVTPR